MILLEKKNYYKLTEPLKQVSINNFFARAVVEHSVSGKVYVNDCDNPRTYYVVHPYGISLLFGDWNNEKFNNNFMDYSLNINRIRVKYEWMQAFPNNWDMVLQELFKDCLIKSSDNIENRENGIIELNTRINFKFNIARYLDFKKKNIAADIKIVRTDKQIFKDMKGSVVPSYFGDSADDFTDKGVGFSLSHENKLTSTAYSAFINDNKLELGIETVEEYRGRGFAQYACSALIDYSIENNLEPIWACRLENNSSYKLAQKLGFEPVLEIPYYRLAK